MSYDPEYIPCVLDHDWGTSPHDCDTCGDGNCLVVCGGCGLEDRSCEDWDWPDA